VGEEECDGLAASEQDDVRQWHETLNMSVVLPGCPLQQGPFETRFENPV